MIRLHRLIARARDDEGMTIVELMISMFIMSVAVFAMIQLMGSTVVGTLRTRQREAAVALANRMTEQIRSNGYTNIYMKDGPTTYVDEGVTYTTLRNTSCSSCLTYSQSVMVSGFTFTVLQVVIGVDDAQDGTGAADVDTDLTLDYKRIIVEVQSTTGPSFDYKTQSIVHDVTKDPVTAVQGLHVEIHDPDNGDTLISDDAFDWTITVSGAGVLDQTVDEGLYNDFALLAGSYTCTPTQTENSKDWYPQGFPAATSDSFACAVTAGTVTNITREWQQREDCLVDATKTGKLWVKVTDADGAGITTASVDPTPTGGQTPDPAAQSVLSNGEIIFTGLPIGPYTIAVSATGYVTQSGLTVCVAEQDPTEPQEVALSANPSPGTFAALDVTVTYTGGGNKVFEVTVVSGATSYEQQQTLKKNTPVTFSFQPVLGTYDVTLYCQKGKNWNRRQQLTAQSFTTATPAYTRSFSEAHC